MADKRWKRIEREKCRALGGERTGPRGFGLPDCVGAQVALEVKSYKRFTFLTKDWEQAVDNAARVGLPPVLAVREAGRGGRDQVQLESCLYARLQGLTADFWCADRLSVPWNDPTVRIPWNEFVQLYRAAYIDNKE